MAKSHVQIHLIWLWLLAVGLTLSRAQTPTAALHLDKRFYVNGECIHYQLYLPGTFPNQAVVRASLIHPDGEVLLHHFTRKESQAHVQGYFQLPIALRPARYFLVFSARTLEGDWVVLAAKSVPVYQDDQVPDAPQLANGPIPMLIRPSLKVSLGSPGGPVPRGEAIDAQIQVTDASGQPVQAQFSVSIWDEQLCGDPTMATPSYTAGFPIDAQMAFDTAITYSGVVKFGGKWPVQSETLGAFLPSQQRIAYTRSNQVGQFVMRLPDFYGEQPIQVADYFRQDIDVTFREPFQVPDAPPLSYSPEILTYLALSRQRKQIYQAFSRTEMPLNPAFPVADTLAWEPDQRINMDEYTLFADLPAFFREVLTPLKFRYDNEGNMQMLMFNPDTRAREFYVLPPMVFVDGKLTRDAEFVAALPIAQVHRIDLFFEQREMVRQFGPWGRSGVVDIRMKSPVETFPPADQARIFSLPGLLPPISYPVPARERASGIPDLRPLLHWQPGARTDATGKGSFSFRQSEDVSTFRITVVARAADGRMGTAEGVYESEW